MKLATTTRNADLGDLVTMLRDQQVYRHDLVLPSHQLVAEGGQLVVTGSEAILTDEGVTSADGTFTPTAVCDEGLAAKLAIPLSYVRRLRAEHNELWDQNINGWMARDPRSFMLRTFSAQDGTDGIARALLSDKYATMDNLDSLLSALDGVKAAGVAIDIDGCDLSDRRMVVRVRCPEIKALAPTLLKGYRSPFSGASGDDNPTVFAGFEISNSETGGGAYTITPRLVVEVCNNGMKITRDAMRAVHLGGKLDAGVINWSAETKLKAGELIKSKTVDAVRTFLDTDYMEKVIARAEAKSEEELSTVDKVRVIAKQAMFTEGQADGILGHFIKSGQMTLGGVFNAATSYAREVADPDEAHAIETLAGRILSLA